MEPVYPAISDSGDVVSLFTTPLFGKPAVVSGFLDMETDECLHDLALAELMDMIEFDCKTLGKLFRGEDLNDVRTSILRHLPQVVDLSTDGEKRRVLVLHCSSIQRILVLDHRARLAAWWFTPYTWDGNMFRVYETEATVSGHEHYTLEDDMIDISVSGSIFEAQGLLTINHEHNVRAPAIVNAIETALGAADENLSSKATLISGACKLFVMLKNIKDPATVTATLIDFLVSSKVTVDLATKAAKSICGLFSVDFTGQSACGVDDKQSLIMLATILCSTIGASALPNSKMLDHVTYKLSNYGKALQGYDSIVAHFGDIFSKVYDVVYEFLYGVPPEKEGFQYLMKELEQWYLDVAEVIPIAYQDEIAVNFETNRRIQLLYGTGLEFSRSFARCNMPPNVIGPFRQHWMALQRVYDRVISQGARVSEPRTEPVCIHIFGGSGVGKSGLTHLLAQDICHLEGMASKVCDETYFRSVEQEFWDGYHGQLVCVYDDFGQRRDERGDPNPEFMELIRSRNIAPFPLHMAHLDEKARTRFVSRAMILTSNKQTYHLGSLTHPEAIWRRIDLQVEVRVKPQYSKNGMIDTSKCSGALDSDVYEFIVRDPARPDYIGSTLSYEQLKEKVAHLYRRCFESSKAKLECLKKRGEQMDASFVAQSNDDYFPALSSDEEEEEDEPIMSIPLDQFLFSAIWMDRVGFDSTFIPPLTKKISRVPVQEIKDIACKATDFFDFTAQTVVYCRMKCIDLLSEITPPENYVTRKTEFLSTPDCHKAKTTVNSTMRYYKLQFKALKKNFSTYWRSIASQLWVNLKKIVDLCVKIYGGYLIASAVFGGIDFVKNLYAEPTEEDNACMRLCARTPEDIQRYHMWLDDEMYLKTMKKGETKEQCRKRLAGQYFDPETKDEVQTKPRKFISETKEDMQRKPRKFVSETKDEDQVRPRRYVAEQEIYYDAKDKFGRPRSRSSSATRYGNFQIEASVDQNAQQLVGPFIANTYILYTWRDGDWKKVVNCVFIKGRIMMMVAHAKVMLRDRCMLRGLHRNDGFEFSLSECNFSQLQNGQGDEVDAMLVEMPRIIVSHKDLTPHFMNNGDLQTFRSVPAYLLLMKMLKTGGRSLVSPFPMLLDTVKALERTLDYRAIPNAPATIELREGYLYKAETEPGDCTSLLVARSPALPRKILGIHVAGNKNGQALSLMITQKMLKRALDGFGFESQVSYTSIPDVDMDLMPNLPDGDFVPLGVLDKNVPSAVRTTLRPSALYGYIMQPKTKPAHLRSTIVDGERVDPRLKGLKKCGISSKPIDQAVLSRCKAAVKASIQGKEQDKRVFTHAEAITGIEGDPFLRPINRKTSPGYPYIFERDGKRGKTKWLGSEQDYNVSEESLLEHCKARIAAAKLGIRLPVLWIDTLKDERRPIAKVDEGKTRVFSAGPMDFILVFRQYFLSFNAHMMRNRIYNECGVGVNPYNIDWHYLAKYLQQVGDFVFAGDFSNFDGTLHPDILWAILDIVNEWYDDGQENAQIRTVLFMEIVNSIHVFDNNVYGWTHSQPSGNPFTAVLNTVYNKMGFRYVFLIVTGKSLRDFEKGVRAIYFGDDSVVSVSPDLIEEYNQETVEKGFKELGMVYTDEAKTGNIVKCKSLTEVNFLKRAFKWDSDLFRFVAPLELDVVLEMPMWVKTDLDSDERCSTTLEKSYGELAIHGEEIFYEWAPFMNSLALQYLEEPPPLLHFLEYRELDLNQI